MKIFSVALIAAAFSTGVMAKVIQDNSAANLRAALIKAGAQAKIMTDASFVTVSKLTCSQEGGIILLPLKCEFVDNGRLVESQGQEAQALVSALTVAGVKPVSTREGEHTTLNLDVKSISCSTMAIHRMISCEIN